MRGVPQGTSSLNRGRQQPPVCAQQESDCSTKAAVCSTGARTKCCSAAHAPVEVPGRAGARDAAAAAIAAAGQSTRRRACHGGQHAAADADEAGWSKYWTLERKA